MQKTYNRVPIGEKCGNYFRKMENLYLTKLSKRTYRFKEIKRAMGDITVKMLSQQLKELVKAKLVVRKDYQGVPPKVEYYLSDNGKTLIPILDEIEKWGVKNKNLVDDYLREIGKI